MAFPKELLDTYFQTFDYPFVRHHIDSYDQFITQDFPAILKANNPFLILKDLVDEKKRIYKYRVEVFVGGLSGNEVEIGTPTVTLQNAKETRVLFPNEARLRNLTYGSDVVAKVIVKVYIYKGTAEDTVPIEHVYNRMKLFRLPMLLHSRFCILHGKPLSFLQEAGECPRDQGGYFIVEGSEKVLVTRQEQAFNTLYITPQPTDVKISTYANITCLSPVTRQVKVISFHWVRSTDTLQVTLPYVRKPVPIFVLFRAMGLQTDRDILELLFPNLSSGEAKMMIPVLLPSLAEAIPFVDSISALEFIKVMTKGASIDHVYDILFNQVFIHITDTRGGSRLHFLAECVRSILRVHLGMNPKTDRDDTRNQRCLTSGLLLRMLFNNAYSTWKKAVRLSIDKVYEYNTSSYQNEDFLKMFTEGNIEQLFNLHLLTEMIVRGFKGKWQTSGSGEEKTGALQSLSRISYLDFMSHCRRVTLNFDTGMKLTGPRQLHPSQYGFFCTNETPGGSSIGIAKNLSLMTLITNGTDPRSFIEFLFTRGWVIPCSEMRNDLLQIGVPVYINNGIVGYTLQPTSVKNVLKVMKWTGCLPAFTSVGFNIKTRRVFIYLDEGRPCRPLIHLDESLKYPKERLLARVSWRDLVLGSFPQTAASGITTTGFFDPFADTDGELPMEKYMEALNPHIGFIEYIDPYEQNEIVLVSFPEEIKKGVSHIELHPSTILSIVNSMVPFANFNQSPRNQLSCSQSKQALSLYATNFQDRYDNSANIMCYAEAPLVRTYVYDVLGSGRMPYGHNLIMAIMSFKGYNQDDGIIFNADSFQRGQFRSINYRSYTCFEENDPKLQTKGIIGNPSDVPIWTDLKPGLDYTKLDERGVIRVGELVDENTVLVGKYVVDSSGKLKDASLTPQVWTSGRVESVVVTVSAQKLYMVKVRITQDRIGELGDKFSTRHGQKGTIGMLYRAHDMPRTEDGLVPDIIVNPHCIPSRMTIAQLMEMIFGWVCYKKSVIGDATTFTTDARAPEIIGNILEEEFNMERTGNVILYDGESGVQMATNIFIGPVYVMRLKHMVEDKWNSRAEGRKEQKTHQPTGGRGAQGGLRIGEMERDALAGHGISGFLKESLMERADKTQFRICNGCGTVPIFNAKQKLFVCPLCDGPVKHIGSSSQTLEILTTMERSLATTSIIEMPYATKLLGEELQTYLNMGMRFLTADSITHLEEPSSLPRGDMISSGMMRPLAQVPNRDVRVPMYKPLKLQGDIVKEAQEELDKMGGVIQARGDAEIVDLPDIEMPEEPPLALPELPPQPQMQQPQMQQPQIQPPQMQPPQMLQPQMLQPQMLQPQMLQPQMLQPQMQQQPPQPQMLQPQMQQQPPQQPQFGGYSQMLQPTSYDYMSPAPYPGGAPTFVVDTSDIHPHQERRTTQRQGRQKAPLTAGGEQVSTQRITIRKLG
jgi:DNA-directed RNA polymerase II subunit RPB2